MAALFTHWYELLCVAVLIIAVFASLWFIGYNYKKERNLEAAVDDDDDDDDDEKRVYRLLDDDEAESEELYSSCSVLWMSGWQCVHPGCLLGLRLVALITLVGLLVWDLHTYDWTIMLYYTEWTLSLIIFYFLIATVISAHGCWLYSKSKSLDHDENECLKGDAKENKSAILDSETGGTRRQVNHKKNKTHGQKAEFWVYLVQVIYQTSAGAVLLTDVVFWGLLAPFLSMQHFHLDLLMGCIHSLNFVFLFSDTILNSLPFPWFRMTYFVLWSCIYICFHWIIHICGFTWWPYPFLELSTPWAPFWYFALALIHVPCYSLYCGLVKTKDWFVHKCSSHAYLRP